MTLENLYRDIFSKLALNNEENNIYANDIIDEINDVIRTKRIEYASTGMGHYFQTTETLNAFSEDASFPFLKSDLLTNRVLDEVPLNVAVFSITGKKVTTPIPNAIASFSKGSLATKENKVYEAVEAISSINSYTLTFKPSQVRNYYRQNGLVYNLGDIIYDKEGGSYYKVTSQFTANIDDDADNIASLTKLYWKEKGSANVYVSVYPYNRLKDLKIFNELPDTEAVTINDNKLYATTGVSSVSLTYIPKWTEVTSFSSNITLPDFMIQDVKNTCVRNLARKLGIEIEMEEDGEPSRNS